MFYFTPLPGFFSPFPHGTNLYRSPSSIQPYGVVPTYSYEVSRASHYSGSCLPNLTPLQDFHLLWFAFPDDSSSLNQQIMQSVPQFCKQIWFGLFLFRSPLLQESSFLSLPIGTKMFQFPTFPSYTLLYSCMDRLTFSQPEFPHSDIHGSKDICSSPWLFAAYHVLLRLLVPRYPPYALCSLIFNVLHVFFPDSFRFNRQYYFLSRLPSSVFRLPISDFCFSTLVYLSSIYLYIFQCAF